VRRRALLRAPEIEAPVSARFEELDWQDTRMGELTLRRRADPATGEQIYEVKLKDEYLMSSLFTVAEEELATLGLAAAAGSDLRVLVGGLGLGYTAATALIDARVGWLTVIDALPAVIGWHERELLPVSAQLVRDERVSLVHDDFFAVVRRAPGSEDVRYDVILLDVDHSPRHTLDPSHADLYTAAGLESLARHLADGGVFALWSDDPPDADFLSTVSSVFDDTKAHVVEFANRLTGGTSSNTVYVAARRYSAVGRTLNGSSNEGATVSTPADHVEPHHIPEPGEPSVPEIEVDETVAPRPEEEVADVARAEPDVGDHAPSAGRDR